LNKKWLYIYIAALLEVCWVSGLKYADGLLSWSATIIAIALSFYFVIKATSLLPVSTAYAVFTGLGAAGTVLVEIIFFDTPFSWIKIGLCTILITGVIGLKMVTTKQSPMKESI